MIIVYEFKRGSFDEPPLVCVKKHNYYKQINIIRENQVMLKIIMVATVALYAQIAISAPNPNFVGDHFSGSGNCVQCHDGLVDTKEGEVSIVKNWSTSMMANASRDPYWQAKVASELYRNPSVSDQVNDK